VFTPVPQVLHNVHFGGAQPREPARVQAAIADAERQLGSAGRVLIRKSGTEPVIRIMAEGENEAQVQALVLQIAEAVESAGRAEAAE